MKGAKKKGYFGRHAKSSAAMVSLIIHAVVLVAAISFVAVKVAIKEDVIFEPKPVQRPRVQLQKLRLPVEMKKKVPPPKLRQRLVTQKKIKPTQLMMPEVTGVSGGTGFLDGDGGLGGFDFKGLKVSFFGVHGGGQRLVFIIDFSGSMAGEKENIMRREASRVIEELPDGVEFAVIFFAGPAWSATSGLEKEEGKWVRTGKGNHQVYPVSWSSLQRIRYKTASRSTKRAVIDAIQKTPLSNGTGTVYDTALFMALNMKPQPSTIFFMTDGQCPPERGINSFRKMLDQLKALGRDIPQVHTIGFGIRGNNQLEEMARLTNGECRFISPDEYIQRYGPNPEGMERIKPDNSFKFQQGNDKDYTVEFELD